MKTKKILTVIAIVLVTAFITGCDIPQDIASFDFGQEQPAEGQTLVRLNLENSNARTIRPAPSPYTQVSEFPNFLLVIHDDDNDPPNTNVTLPPAYSSYFTFSNFATSISLDTGTTYTFLVIACGPGPSYAYLAWGTDTRTINGSTDVVSIELTEICGDAPSAYIGTGTFAWNVGTSLLSTGGYTYAQLKLDALGGGNKVDENMLTMSNNVGSNNTIPSGYYKMVLELRKTDCQTVFIQEIVHIYSGLVSTYQPLTLPTLRSTKHEITYDYGTDSLNGGMTDEYVTHGAAFSTITNTAPTHTNSADYYFDTWYLDDLLTTPMVGTALVLKPTELYAKWIAYKVPALGDYDVTGSFAQNVGNTSAINVTAKVNGDRSPGTVTVYYTSHGDGGVAYPKNTTLPPSAGTYDVTFSVAAALSSGWKATPSDINVGTELVISALKTPVASDYDVSDNLIQSENSISAVTVTAKVDGDRSGGAVTVYYTSHGDSGVAYPKNTTPPSTAGTYDVTFNVAADTGWAAANDLSAGTLIITKFFSIIVVERDDLEDPEIEGSPVSYATYNNTAGTLTIHVELSDAHGASTYEWFDDMNNLLGSAATLNLNLTTSTLAWWTAGDFTLTLITDKGSTTFKFVHTW